MPRAVPMPTPCRRPKDGMGHFAVDRGLDLKCRLPGGQTGRLSEGLRCRLRAWQTGRLPGDVGPGRHPASAEQCGTGLVVNGPSASERYTTLPEQESQWSATHCGSRKPAAPGGNPTVYAGTPTPEQRNTNCWKNHRENRVCLAKNGHTEKSIPIGKTSYNRRRCPVKE